MPKLILTLLFFCCTIQMYSQPPTQEELEERKAKIQLEIQEKEQLLQSVKSKEKSVVTQLQIQKEKIGLKEKLIKIFAHKILSIIEFKSKMIMAKIEQFLSFSSTFVVAESISFFFMSSLY